MILSNKKINRLSYLISFAAHILFLIFLWFFNLSLEYKQQDFVELSFGSLNKQGSSGATGEQIKLTEENAKQFQDIIDEKQNTEHKKVELPKAKTAEEENIIKSSEKSKETKKQNTPQPIKTENSNINVEGQGNLTDGKGSLGFDIDWGGLGTRKIYSYILPDYPEGVQKEIDIRLRFTIKPDGTVGSVTLLTKADTRLEQAAINSLWQWRFEPLPQNIKQVNQAAVIVFPYRLR